jgi:tRNA pseudouridine65 synthase
MLDVLYRDDHLVAVHKPAGLLVHRSDLDRHETRFAVQFLRDQIGRHVHPVHRLDKGTSGVLLFALDAESARIVGGQFERDEVVKRYLAIVRGWPAESGRIDHALSRRFDDHGRKLAPEDRPPPRPAFTSFRRLATIEIAATVDRYPQARYALLELTPETGRQHQLRRHLKHIAHPIVGDATWGKGVHNRFFQRRFDCHRLLLACTGITLRHPRTNMPIIFESPPEPAFAAVMTALGWIGALERYEKKSI